MSLLHNYVLVAALAAWLLAQLIKLAIGLATGQKRSVRELLLTGGGMPSGHSATVCALSTALACQEGFASPLFALSVILALLVMYDAVGVRQAAGQQARVLNQMIRQTPAIKPKGLQHQLKEQIGHNLPEVVAGALLGVGLALVFGCGFLQS